MIVVQVFVRVRPEAVDGFLRATLANAASSLEEPGIARFDVLQQQDDPTRFVLIEAYRSEHAIAAHKQTRHYLTWRDAVTDLMAEPRTSTKSVAVFPPDDRW